MDIKKHTSDTLTHTWDFSPPSAAWWRGRGMTCRQRAEDTFEEDRGHCQNWHARKEIPLLPCRCLIEWKCVINKPLNRSGHAPLWPKSTSVVNSTKMMGRPKTNKQKKTPQLADLSANAVDACWISRQHLFGALFSPAVAREVQREPLTSFWMKHSGRRSRWKDDWKH